MSIFRKAANFLKKNANTEYPIFIRRIKMNSEMEGYCQFKKDHFIVKINKNLNEAHSIDVAMHEVAHAMSWGKDADIHGPSWGLCYSKLYRKFLDNFING